MAKPRPKLVRYGDATHAMQDSAYGALQGEVSAQDALNSLQSKVESLTQKA